MWSKKNRREHDPSVCETIVQKNQIEKEKEEVARQLHHACCELARDIEESVNIRNEMLNTLQHSWSAKCRKTQAANEKLADRQREASVKLRIGEKILRNNGRSQTNGKKHL